MPANLPEGSVWPPQSKFLTGGPGYGGSPMLWIGRKNDINNTQKQHRRLQTRSVSEPKTETMIKNSLTLARKPCFATFAGVGGWGWCDPPLGVSKRSVVELRGKDQQISFAEYSRLVVLFLVLGQHLTQLWQVKGQIFVNSMIFQLHESIASKLSIVAAWNLHQRVPHSFLHRMLCFDASQLNI